jgi:hypothetical protein
MFMESHYLVYPNGDNQEINGPAPFNALVGLNGEPLSPPLQKGSIVYRVYRINRDEGRGERSSFYHLELVSGPELLALYR